MGLYIWSGKNVIEHLHVLHLLRGHVRVQVVGRQEPCDRLSTTLPNGVVKVLENKMQSLSSSLHV